MDFAPVWNLRNKRNDKRRDKLKNTLLTTENTLTVAREQVSGEMDEISDVD